MGINRAKVYSYRAEILAVCEKTEEYEVRGYWRRKEERVAYNMQKQREREKTDRRKQDEESQKQRYEYYRQYADFISSGAEIKNKELANELIKAGFKQLSKKYHPDSGGTDGQFKELNNLKEQLDKLVKVGR